MEHASLFLMLAVGFGFVMAWAVGANDVANTMGTSVGSKVLTIKQAIVVAAIFEALGALLASGHVTNTIRRELIDVHMFAPHPELLIYGMLAALLASATWLVTATFFGWPVSTTHSIVGAVIGFACVTFGPSHVHWGVVTNIFLSWVVTPMISGLLAFGLFKSVQYSILKHRKPFERAKRYVPAYIFLVAIVISFITLVEGLKPLGLHFNMLDAWGIAVLLSLGCAWAGLLLMRRIERRKQAEGKTAQHFALVEQVFGVLAVFTACAMAFAHGSNDVANAIGPVAAVVSVVNSGGQVAQSAALPYWVILLGAVGIVLGLAMYGYKVIATIGGKITPLTASRGFAAQLATASTVIISSGFGLPVSTTQTLVGAVLGVGLAGGIGALNLGVVRNIFMSWVVTLPSGAFLAIVFYQVIKWSFS